ncbi:hypothetical protein [Peribacillus sp. Hz7]|uniref:hypothetical protein n=1 Tax=Peribacillus sp. Hz7 TaxID=3344873 RepID=UPI0035CB33C7
MLTISKDIKRRDLPDHIQEGLTPFSTVQIKGMIFAYTFLLLDFLIIMPLLFPVIKPILYVTFPLMAMINIWAIALLIRKPEKTEMESLLFIGGSGIIGSFCYFMLILKYSYMLGFISPIYYVIWFIIYAALIYFFVRQQIKKYSSLEKQSEKKTPAWQYTLVSISVPAGYIVAQYVMSFSQSILLSIMMLVYWIFCIFFIFIMARSFHKYFFIKKNMHVAYFANKELYRKVRGLD